MRRIGTWLAYALAIGLTLGLGATAASAATSSIPFTTCTDAPDYGCAHLTVPLDPTNAVPGTVTLAVRRKLAQTGTASEAVIALAGGPGQAALPFAKDAAQIMSAALGSRDLVVFDQRGTGTSGPLACSALNLNDPISKVIPDCAGQIGATRGLYTSDDTVFDIEQLRVALGYTKLVLYGTSYGTKVALRYAAEYPQNVAALVLDSTVPANGPDVFDQSTYQAVPRILTQLCAAHACPGIASPVHDLETVLARLSLKAEKTTFYDGTGKALRFAINPGDIASLLLGGDDDPVLRADFPAAIHAAAQGRYGLLAILIDHAIIGSQQPNSTIDNPLFFDTECEELPFPWNRAAPAATRLVEAYGAAAALPAGSFGPFSVRTAVNESSAAACAYWPFASAAAEPTINSEPNVPTLIISGADDLRTPTSNATGVATMIPDANVVVVPQTGHSVLTTEFGSCALDAVNAFFNATPIATTCASKSNLPSYLRATGAAPSALASLSPASGTHGLPGRTAHAVSLTLDWTARELSESLFETLIGGYNPSYNHGLGGLYGGYAKQSTSKTTLKITVRFHAFSYVSGVTITGSVVSGTGTLHVAGPGGANGTVTATTPSDFFGTLGGTHVHFRIPSPSASGSAASL